MENIKKKIGIITFHNAHNYGAMLQVYALQKILEKYETKVIDFKNKGIEKEYGLFKVNKRNLVSAIKSIGASIVFLPKNLKRRKKFNDFMNSKLKLSQTYKTESELKLNPPAYDIYITGSDQVWNYELSCKQIDAYTLNFGNDSVKRISYAASMGTTELNAKFKEKYIQNILRFDNISIRESVAEEYFEKILGRKVDVTLDPTLLLDKKVWNEEIEPKEKKERYILAYMLSEDNEFYRILNYLSEITGLKVIHLNKKNKGIKNILRNAYSDGPIEFLGLIKNAEYVVATSFHATVFSLIFNKKFWVVPPKKIGSRITSILEKLQISDRAISSLEEFEKLDYDKEIDYVKVNKILEMERKKSIEWLENAIDS